MEKPPFRFEHLQEITHRDDIDQTFDVIVNLSIEFIWKNLHSGLNTCT